jgi:hypothetical protein
MMLHNITFKSVSHDYIRFRVRERFFRVIPKRFKAFPIPLWLTPKRFARSY